MFGCWVLDFSFQVTFGVSLWIELLGSTRNITGDYTTIMCSNSWHAADLWWHFHYTFSTLWLFDKLSLQTFWPAHRFFSDHLNFVFFFPCLFVRQTPHSTLNLILSKYTWSLFYRRKKKPLQIGSITQYALLSKLANQTSRAFDISLSF